MSKTIRGTVCPNCGEMRTYSTNEDGSRRYWGDWDLDADPHADVLECVRYLANELKLARVDIKDLQREIDEL